MSRRRKQVMVAVIVAWLCLGLAGCSPNNQGAVTLDERTGRPKLVLTYCDGEAIESVRLVVAPDAASDYEEQRTLWRIEAAQPRVVRSVVVGEVPDGFKEVVPLEGGLRGRLLLAAEANGGIAAEQDSGVFSVSELESEVLLQSGRPVSRSDLRRYVDQNCNGTLLGSLGLPSWLGTAARIGFAAMVVAVIALFVRDRPRRKRAALNRLPPPPSAPW